VKIAIPDDNPGRGEVFPSAFKLKGHDVSVHQEPATFLTSIIQENRPTKPAPFDLMIVDVCLPGLYSRAQVMHSLHMVSAELPAVLCSATDPARYYNTLFFYWYYVSLSMGAGNSCSLADNDFMTLLGILV